MPRLEQPAAATTSLHGGGRAESAASRPTLEARVAAEPHRFRVLTGDRPTGALHLGHYFGTLANRVRLQNLGVETYLVIADYQVITDRDLAGDLPGNVREMLLDQLAAGIDPARTTIFTHSAVPALNQLLLPLLSLVSVAELQRNPTVKAETAAAGIRAMSGLMLTYPVHQAADILFCSASLVPVGHDQLAHLEVTRTLARRFNDRYCPQQPVFTVPEALVGQAPTLLGIDGRKMSKSRGNAIELRASADQTSALIRRAKTDSDRRITYEPDTRPEVANLLLLAGLCRDEQPAVLAEQIGDRGASALKALVSDAVNDHFAPLRRRRAELTADAHTGGLNELLARGNDHANLPPACPAALAGPARFPNASGFANYAGTALSKQPAQTAPATAYPGRRPAAELRAAHRRHRQDSHARQPRSHLLHRQDRQRKKACETQRCTIGELSAASTAAWTWPKRWSGAP